MISQDDWKLIRQVLEVRVDLEEIFDAAMLALQRRIDAQKEAEDKIEELSCW